MNLIYAREQSYAEVHDQLEISDQQSREIKKRLNRIIALKQSKQVLEKIYNC
jgi:hypothetical protein